MPLFRLFFSVLGLGLIGLFIYCLGNELLFLSSAQAATATVVALEMDDARGGASHKPGAPPLLFPAVRFVTAQGQVVTVVAPAGSTNTNYVVGQRVPLRYDPAHPHHIELPDFFSRWGSIAVTGLFALFGWSCLRAGMQRFKSRELTQPEWFDESDEQHQET